MKLITQNFEKKETIQFVTLMTRFDEYQEMVNSAKQAGFEDAEFLYFNNKESNEFDGFSGINYAIKHCTSKYLIFCHQDILFNHDTKDTLLARIKDLEQIDPDWAIIGNAGVTEKGKVILKITDPHGPNQTKGPFPSQVMSVDENFIVINTKHNLSCSTQMKGFHLYGIDLCQNAAYLGLKSYVLDFHLTHNSKGNIDKSFFSSQQKYINLEKQRKQIQVYYTTCTKFIVSFSSTYNYIFNGKIFKRILFKLLNIFGK